MKSRQKTGAKRFRRNSFAWEIPREPTVREDARQRLTELNDQLHSAFSALDVAAARPFRDEWKQKRQFAQLEDSDALVEQVKPILEWLNDEDRKSTDTRAFSKTVTDIEQALERNMSRSKI